MELFYRAVTTAIAAQVSKEGGRIDADFVDELHRLATGRNDRSRIITE